MISKMTKCFAVVLVLVMVALAFAGCGSGNNAAATTAAATAAATEAAATTAAPAAPVTVTFMTWESKEMNQALLDSFQAFTKDNPDITVQLVPSPLSDYGTKLQQMIAANQAPSAFYTGNDWEQQYGAQGLLQDWTDYAAKDSAFLDKYFPATVDAYKIDGKLFGLPGLMNVYGIFYNKDLFKAANLAEPKAGWTLQEYLDDAKKLADPAKKVYGTYGDGFTPFEIGMLNASNGGAPFTDNLVKATKVTADQGFKDIVSKVAEGMKAGYLMPPEYDTSNVQAAFEAGKIPMWQAGQWMAVGIMNDAKSLNWGYVAEPNVGSTASAILDCVGFASPANVKNPDAVWKMLKYLDTQAYSSVLAKTPVASTSFGDIAQVYFDTMKAAGHQDVADGVKVMLAAPNKQPVRFLQNYAGDAQKVIDADWNKIIEGKEPVSKIDDIVKAINDIIAKSK